MKLNTGKALSIFALILMLTAMAMMTSTQPVKAATIATYAFLTVQPNPVGVGQTVSVNFWLDNPPPTANGPQGDRWEGMKVTITKPDGKTEIKGPYRSDDVGAAWFLYVPALVGNYTFKLNFPGQNITYQGNKNWYTPSESQTVSLVVQEAPLPTWQDTPLPSGFWERPIYGQNREWWKISGNWLFPTYNTSYSPFGGFNAYSTAPNTAHIVWTKPIDFGGLIGGEFGTVQYYTGESYEGKWSPIIMQGRIYHNQRLSSSGSLGLACIDIRTGQTLWFKENMSITNGQIYNYNSPNQHGGIPYLWSTSGSTWSMYDAFTGNLICTFTGASAGGKIVLDTDGTMLSYNLGSSGRSLSLWNSTKVIAPSTTATGPGAWMWRPTTGRAYTWSTGIMWTRTSTNDSLPVITGLALNKVGSDMLLATNGGFGMSNNVTYVCYSAKTGLCLWNRTYTDISLGSNEAYFGSSNTQLLDGVFERFTKSTMQFHGFDAYTGDEIWTSEPFTNAWGMYDETGCTAYGKFYTMAYDGMIHAYDLHNGTHLWDYYGGSSGFETVYGQWPFYVVNGWAIADNKIFAPNGEHSPDSPTWRGWKLHVVDATTGKGVWNISGFMKNPAIADGYLVTLNLYDCQIYCFGKGDSATTVSAPQTVSAKGIPVVVSGTVTDQSPGKSKGTPAIADKDMTPWMEYVYEQQSKPASASGVQVKLVGIDSNGNNEEIGTVTSDMAGNYGVMWTPKMEGLYKIVASFEGSESYYASGAETYVGVGAAPLPSAIVTPTSTPTATPTATAAPTASPSPAASPPGYGLGTEYYVAIAAVVIVVVIAAMAIALRKSK